MSLSIWQTIVADFKAGLIDAEGLIAKVDAMVVADAKGIGGLVWNLISTDANTLVADFGPDLQQIVTNIQNTTVGLSLSTFPELFMTAVLPVLEKEGLKLVAADWTIITAYFAANNNITSTPANNGNLLMVIQDQQHNLVGEAEGPPIHD